MTSSLSIMQTEEAYAACSLGKKLS